MLDTTAALTHFKSTDPIMAALLTAALRGNEPLTLPTVVKPKDYFNSIASSIVSQQISTHAARAIKGRIKTLLGNITPEAVIAVPFAELKACGLSEKKTQYLKHNAELWHEIPYKKFASMEDEAIIHELTKLYGVGRWTAEMFLLFSLVRPNVFSYGDLALMQGVYRHYNHKPHHIKKIKTTIEAWSPHQSIASLTLWHSKDTALPL